MKIEHIFELLTKLGAVSRQNADFLDSESNQAPTTIVYDVESVQEMHSLIESDPVLRWSLVNGKDVRALPKEFDWPGIMCIAVGSVDYTFNSRTFSFDKASDLHFCGIWNSLSQVYRNPTYRAKLEHLVMGRTSGGYRSYMGISSELDHSYLDLMTYCEQRGFSSTISSINSGTIVFTKGSELVCDNPLRFLGA